MIMLMKINNNANENKMKMLIKNDNANENKMIMLTKIK